MDCKEALELVTPAVDGKLAVGDESQLQDHFEKCPACRSEFELEHITKRAFKLHMSRVPAPQALAECVRTQLSAETLASNFPQFEIRKFLFQPTWKTFATAAGAVAVLLLIVLIPFKPQHSHTRPADDNVINQTYNNFGEVLKGTIVPGISSENPSEVKNYIDPKVGFHTHVPLLKHGTLVGAVQTHYNDENVAHIIYRQKDNVIYLYQARLQSVMDGHTLRLPDSVKREILRTGWYFEKQCAGCTLMVWTVDSTVCCAIADMGKPELVEFFKETE